MFLLASFSSAISNATAHGFLLSSDTEGLWVSISIAFDHVSSLSTQAFPLEDMEHVSNKDDVKTSLRKVVKEVRSGCCKLTSSQGDHIGDVPGEQRKLNL